jgi:hypothetical protein
MYELWIDVRMLVGFGSYNPDDSSARRKPGAFFSSAPFASSAVKGFCISVNLR